eukprot:403346127
MNNTTTTQQSTISNHGNSNNSFVLNINNPSADVVQIRELIDDFRNLLANNIMPHVIQGQPIHAPGPAQLPQPQNPKTPSSYYIKKLMT